MSLASSGGRPLPELLPNADWVVLDGVGFTAV
jgi:hypothetical protein